MATPRFPLILRTAHGYEFFNARQILRIDAEDKYARITTDDGARTVVLHPLSDLQERLCCGQRVAGMLFLRTHRSCIVAMHHVQGVDADWALRLNDAQRAPVGREAWRAMLKALGWIDPRAAAEGA